MFEKLNDNQSAMLAGLARGLLGNRSSSLADGLAQGLLGASDGRANYLAQLKAQREEQYMLKKREREDLAYEEDRGFKREDRAQKKADDLKEKLRMERLQSSDGLLGYNVPLNTPQAQGLLNQTSDLPGGGLPETNSALDYADRSGRNTPMEAPRLGAFVEASQGLPPQVQMLMRSRQKALDRGAYKDPKDVADSVDKGLEFGLNLMDKQEARTENNQMRRDLANQSDQTRRDIAAENIAVRREISAAARSNRPSPYTVVEDGEGNRFWADSRNPNAPTIPILDPSGAPVRKNNRDKLQQDAIALYNTMYPISMMGQRQPGSPSPQEFIKDYIAKRHGGVPVKTLPSPARKTFNPATGRIE